MPGARFDHVFLTRFRVRFTADQPSPDEAWLRYRLGFFAEATVASMRAQTMLPDRWLVFVDDQSSAWLIDELHALGAGVFDVVRLSQPGATCRFGQQWKRSLSAPS
jgi:hypothetical protein